MTAKRGKNPLLDFWLTCALGGDPTNENIGREGFPTQHVAEVRAGVRAVHRLKNAGEMEDGRALARQLAGEWFERLGDQLQPASSDPLRGEMDPRRLAQGVRRRW